MMNDNPVRHETVEAELQRLVDDLRGAGPEVVAAETARLRALAERVQDEAGRERALSRAAELPRLVAGPRVPSSPEFGQAEQLLQQAINDQRPASVRIPAVEQAMARIGELATQAPAREAFAIRRLLSPLARLLDHLRATAE
jgi:hypothetical protein